MLGAVIGDVVGSVYEFHNTRDYNFPMFSPSSNYTDDTVMTMAVADWTMKCKAAGETAYPHQLLEECMVKVPTLILVRWVVTEVSSVCGFFILKA